jgi:uncharacterized lipoprotein YmbA
VKSLLTSICLLSLLCACATSRQDHFYILSARPPGTSDPRANPTTVVSLRVTLPSVVDRPEMVLNTSPNGVILLEHERWAAPPADLVRQTLVHNLERRRSDMLVTDHPGGTAVKISVDVVQMSARKGERASIEAHWRILDPRSGGDVVGAEVFSAPLARDDYAAVPEALSDCLGLLADRLAGQLR